MKSKSPVSRVQSRSIRRGAGDGGGAVLDDHLAIGGQDRRAVDQHLVARIDDGAVVEADMGVQAFEAVADLDGAGHLFVCCA